MVKDVKIPEEETEESLDETKELKILDMEKTTELNFDNLDYTLDISSLLKDIEEEQE